MKTSKHNKKGSSSHQKRPIVIRRIQVQNFRLLKRVRLNLEERVTLIVGRNNSGKTSVMELLGRLFSNEEPTFDLEDFSLSSYRRFWKALKMKSSDSLHEDIYRVLPKIKIKIVIGYDTTSSDLGNLSECIIDLDPDCDEVVLDIAFSPIIGKIDTLLEWKKSEGTKEKRQKIFFNAIRERINKCYELKVEAVDPNDKTNRKLHKWSILSTIVKSDLIKAQRGLDEQPHNVLGRILERLFSSAESESADARQRTIAQQLDEAVANIQEELSEQFNSKLTELLPAFGTFGYPGLSDPELVTETSFNTKKLLNGHTRVLYSGHSGVNLPENLNGLGTRNLIYILLRLYAFFHSYKQQNPRLGVHIICIEEPEAHLHPQMQEVFIRRIESIVDNFSNEMNDGDFWPVQFVISTHSSHIANEAYFESVRYFLATSEASHNTKCRAARVTDLRKMFHQVPEQTRNFIHKYMTLTRCDLFFADKAILIEGAAERILLPKMIEKIDAESNSSKKLASQYITVMEVGGAYAYQFFQFLSILDLPTLIITDIDSVKAPKNRACRVSEGNRTSNASIKYWFRSRKNKNEMTPTHMIKFNDADKTVGNRRIAYQIPEKDSAACGRSFEDAFVLANLDRFRREMPENRKIPERFAWDYVGTIKKTEFAIKYAITESDWVVPRYIADGLRWLAAIPCQSSSSDRLSCAVSPKSTEETMRTSGTNEEANA